MPKRVLVVTGQKPITTVQTKSGGQSTLYEVYATDERGEIVEEPLRAFTELEEGVAIEYDVERYNHKQYGTSYTLTPPRRNSAKRLREAEDQLARLTAWAVQQGFDPERFSAAADRTEDTLEAVKDRGDPVPAPENEELDEKFGEEAPWSDEDLDKKPEDIEL